MSQSDASQTRQGSAAISNVEGSTLENSVSVSRASVSGSSKHWVIAGAGSVGFWLGAHLVNAGEKVTFLARSRIIEVVKQHGVLLSSWTGKQLHVPADRFRLTDDDRCISQADVIVVSVKSKDTFVLGERISRLIKPGAEVISAQNGIYNGSALKSMLPDHKVVSMMVPYNILSMEQGRYHCGTEGKLVIDSSMAWAAGIFSNAGLEVQVSDDMDEVLWGKLIINLNNALNALSGLTLVEELSDRRWRKKLANCMDEALDILNGVGICPQVQAPIPASWIPNVLRLPTFLFKLLARSMLQIDPLARSSMQEDISLGRPTEIDYINGEVVRYARSLGIRAPVNEQVIIDIKKMEQQTIHQVASST